MKFISVNAGSSSLKFKLFEMPQEKLIASGLIEKIGSSDGIFTAQFDNIKKQDNMVISNHQMAVELLLDFLKTNNVIKNFNELNGIGHRIVQGGEFFKDSVILTHENILKIESLNDLAPLHNYASILAIRAFQKILPQVCQIGVFDTTFHQTIPQENFLYAVPYEWYQNYKVRKYGFHGISYKYVTNRATKLLGQKNSKLIICHIGNGVSLCAIKNNISIDTSMGFTPLEGVPMGTRSGNIDPVIIEFMMKQKNQSATEVINDLHKKSGYIGISGISNDARDLEEAVNSGSTKALLAYNIQIKRIIDYIGSYYFLLKGIDALIFTAGIGENSLFLREKIIKNLSFLQVQLDPSLNQEKGERIISTSDSPFKVLVIPTNEEIEIVREILKFSYYLN